jgi:hypothetical protein
VEVVVVDEAVERDRRRFLGTEEFVVLDATLVELRQGEAAEAPLDDRHLHGIAADVYSYDPIWHNR